MDIAKLLPLAFKLLANTDKIRKLVQDSQPAVDELKKIWPEAAPLIKDIVQRSLRLYELAAPTADASLKAWPVLKPTLISLSDQLWPEMAAQWSKQQKESTLPPLTVRWLQENLNTLGAQPHVLVDGNMGDASHKAIRDYQKKKGLKDDGWAGPETLANMLKDLG